MIEIAINSAHVLSKETNNGYSIIVRHIKIFYIDQYYSRMLSYPYVNIHTTAYSSQY